MDAPGSGAGNEGLLTVMDDDGPSRASPFQWSELFGYTLSAAPLRKLARTVRRGVSEADRSYRLMALNPRKVALADRNPVLKRALHRAEVLFPDGYGVCLAHRAVEGQRIERVPGIDLVSALLEEGSDRRWRVYVFGAQEPINERAAENIERRYPNLTVVGRHHGYFKENETRGIVEAVQNRRPHIILVGLGSPAQELWIDRHFSHLASDVAIGVGGTLDVLAGVKDRAPAVLRAVRLEWLYRVASEPRRLARILDTHTAFAGMTIAEIMRQGKRDEAPYGGDESTMDDRG